jgi:UDP-N-acetylmuramyl pentapeptide synthase
MDINDAVILVKGSRGMKMEEFSEIIKKRMK